MRSQRQLSVLLGGPGRFPLPDGGERDQELPELVGRHDPFLQQHITGGHCGCSITWARGTAPWNMLSPMRQSLTMKRREPANMVRRCVAAARHTVVVSQQM